MEQHKQSCRSLEEHSVVLGSEVATQLAQLTVNLRAVGKGQVRNLVAEQVETSDVVAHSDTAFALK
jgi:hypothetical protein